MLNKKSLVKDLIKLEEEFVGVAEDEDQPEGNVPDVLDIFLRHIFMSTPADTVPGFQEPEVEGKIQIWHFI